MKIPEKYQEFCREVAKLATRLNVDSAEITLKPAYDEDWKGEIKASWEAGLHGSMAHKIFIESNVRVHTDLSGNPKGFHR